MSFSEQLKKARNNIGYSQEKIAFLLNINPSTYCYYESGKRHPDVLKIKQLTAILNVSADFLLETSNQKDDCLKAIIESYYALSEIGKKEAEKRVKELTYLEDYVKKTEFKEIGEDLDSLIQFIQQNRDKKNPV